MSSLEGVDWAKIDQKYSNTKIVQKSRLWASLKLNRLQKVEKLMKIIGEDEKLKHWEKVKKVLLENDYPNCQKIKDALKGIDEENNLPWLIGLLKELKIKEISSIGTTFGKLTYKDGKTWRDVNMNRVRNWFFNDREHTIDGNKDKFTREFTTTLRSIIESGNRKCNVSNISLKTFVTDYTLWARTGAVEFRDMVKYFEVNTGIKIKRTKWSYAAHVDPEKLMNHINYIAINKLPPKYNIIEKEESEAVRLIVLGDLVTYILMSYISLFIEPYLTNADGLYMYCDDKKKCRFWINKLKTTKMRMWNLDLDYSGWDEGITHLLTDIVCGELVRLFRKLTGNLDKVFDYVTTSISSSYIKGLGKTKSGLPSGSRWTTLINSLINSTILRMAYEGTKEMDDALTDYMVAGDDCDVTVSSSDMAHRMMKYLTMMGFDINEYKSGLSNKRGEFLKMHYNKDSVGGEPTRMLRSLLWSTEDERFLIGDEKRVARIAVWGQLISRVRYWYGDIDYETIEKTIVDDLFHSFNSRNSKKDIRDYLRTPSTMGGAGIIPLKPSSIVTLEWKIEENNPDGRRAVISKIVTPPGHYDNDDNERLKSIIFDIITGNRYKISKFQMVKYRILDFDLEEIQPYDDNLSLPRLGYSDSVIPINIEPMSTNDHPNLRFKSMAKRRNMTRKEVISYFNNNKPIKDARGNVYDEDTLIPLDLLHKLTSQSTSVINMMLNNEIQTPSKPAILQIAAGEMLTDLLWSESIAPFLSNLAYNNVRKEKFLKLLLSVEIYFRSLARGKLRLASKKLIYY